VAALASLIVGLGVRFAYPTLAEEVSPSAFLRFADTCVLFAILFHVKCFVDGQARPGEAQQPEG
jgi:hypothetical protein